MFWRIKDLYVKACCKWKKRIRAEFEYWKSILWTTIWRSAKKCHHHLLFRLRCVTLWHLFHHLFQSDTSVNLLVKKGRKGGWANEGPHDLPSNTLWQFTLSYLSWEAVLQWPSGAWGKKWQKKLGASLNYFPDYFSYKAAYQLNLVIPKENICDHCGSFKPWPQYSWHSSHPELGSTSPYFDSGSGAVSALLDRELLNDSWS